MFALKQNYKNTNKIIGMSETPLKGFTKYQTINFDERNNKGLASTSYRLTQRKSNSVLANPESLMSTTIPNIAIDHNLSLPKINKKKKEKKQGTFLQSWLDQALGAPDPYAQQKPESEDKIQGNVLKTLKKFQLDKRHLQSQNIPAEKVEKLYRNLYIYSHGVNKIFQQLIELTKQKQNNELVGNFWKAYTKLLESCTSYQTIFQQVQRDHLQTIEKLKRNIFTQAQSFEEQRKELQSRLKKSDKALEQKQNLYNNLKTDYDVLKSTLDLTDEAFNEQVNLRLKFEQKINAVYTSYEQLKNKYTKVVQEMGIKNLDIVERDNKEDELKSKLLVERTKVDELMFLLKAERDKVKERQAQIVIKNQQMEDIKTTLLAKSNEEDNTHDKMEEYISKMKALKTKLIQVQNVVSGQKITIKQQQEHIAKMTKSLQEYKQHNNEIYEKYAGSGKKIVGLESEIQKNNLKLNDLEKLNMEKSGQIADLNRELEHVKNQRDGLRHDLNISTKNLKDTKETMTKNNVILQDMKAVKDKYERINEFLKDSVKDLQTSNNQMNQDLSLKTEELQGMKLLIDNKTKSLVQMEKQLQQQREVNKGKIVALNSVIAKKEALSLEYQKKKQEAEKEVSDTKIMLKLTEEKVILVESEKIKLQVQLSSKQKVLKQLETMLTKESQKYKQLNEKLEGQLKQKSGINSKLMTTEFVLKTKNQEDRVEVLMLGNLLNEYKMKFVERAQYVHPMLFEEALETARRCADNQAKYKKDNDRLKTKSAELTQKSARLQQVNKELNQKIVALQSKIQNLTEDRLKLLEKIKKFEEQVKSLTTLYQKQQKVSKGYKDDIEGLKNVQKNLKDKNQGLEEVITNLKIKIEEMIQQSRKKSRSQTREVKREAKKQMVAQEVQTDPIQIDPEPQQAEQKQVALQITKVDQQIQTQIQQQSTQKIPQIMTSMYKQPQPIRKQQVPQKKVESKQFRKALKLTYMRR